MKYADLHVHTHYSDSTFSPEEVVSCAKERGLSAVAICDHDCVDGIDPCRKAGVKYGVEIIPGIELTAESTEIEAHVLGYFIDYRLGWLQKKLRAVQKARIERVHKIVKKLDGEGISIRPKDVFGLAGKGSVTRFHIAKAILKSGKVKTFREIFEKYLGFSKPCYVPNVSFLPEEAIGILLKAGGVPVIAHPYLMRNDGYIKELISCGLRGLEARHPEHSMAITKRYQKMAEENNLLVTGGSDCHGLGKGRILMGAVRVEYGVVERLREEADRIRNENSKIQIPKSK